MTSSHIETLADFGDGSSYETPLALADVNEWRAWLDANESSSDGVWLLMAKKGVDGPTDLTVGEALDEALCSGWIDGQRRARDGVNFVQRFTPRRPRSLWSARNVGYITRLDKEGRMRPRGLEEVEKAKADGRWDAAYEGPAKMGVPPALDAALKQSPRAKVVFDSLNRTDRYSILHPIATARTDETRDRRIAKAVARLEESSDQI